MSFEGLLSVSTNSSALCHESFSRASDPSFSSCFLPACFVCPHKDYRSTSKDVSSVFDRWLWYVAIKGVRTCRTRQGPSVHWVSHHGFSSFPRVHERSMHDPTFAHLSSTLQRVGLALGSTRVSNGRGRVACVRFCTLPTHGEPAWGRHLSTGVAEGVDASGRDDPSWKCLPRLIMHGTHLGRGFLSLPVLRRDWKQGPSLLLPRPQDGNRGWKTSTRGSGMGRTHAKTQKKAGERTEDAMPFPDSQTSIRRPRMGCPLPPPPPPPPPYNPGEEEEKKRDPAASSIPPIPVVSVGIGRIHVDRTFLLHACTRTTMSHPHEPGS